MKITKEAADLRRKIVVRLYTEDGQSIRAIGEALGMGYGTVHRDLTESGVTLRPRGGRGPNRTPPVRAEGGPRAGR